jgi:hypothetical protein
MSLFLALLSFATASAAEERELTWAVTLDGKPVGQRSMTVKFLETKDGEKRRVIEAWTEIDATVLGLDYKLRERLTAHCGREPAAFHAVTDLSGNASEVQARRPSTAWIVTVNLAGREFTKEYAAASIDLSTADLLDPDSRVPISAFDTAKVLTAETGDILEGKVARLGPDEVDVAGTKVGVDGYSWTPTSGPGATKLWYTVDGWLVRYEISALGKTLVGTLTTPPPVSEDVAPIEESGSGIEEINL